MAWVASPVAATHRAVLHAALLPRGTRQVSHGLPLLIRGRLVLITAMLHGIRRISRWVVNVVGHCEAIPS
eukprot:4500901-Pyramimonas_sp.AAC.1